MKIEVNANQKIIVHLEHVIDVNDLAWAVIWQRFIEKNETPLSRLVIWRWALANIIEGRLYKSHAMSEAARLNMHEARRLVDEHYPEFTPVPAGSFEPEPETETALVLQLQQLRPGASKLFSKFRTMPVRCSRVSKPARR